MGNGHYYSDILDFNTYVWWRCDDENTTEIKGIPYACYSNVPLKYIGKYKEL